MEKGSLPWGLQGETTVGLNAPRVFLVPSATTREPRALSIPVIHSITCTTELRLEHATKLPKNVLKRYSINQNRKLTMTRDFSHSNNGIFQCCLPKR